MKNLVIPIKDYIIFLEDIQNEVAEKLKQFPTAEELKNKTAAAVTNRKKEKGVLLFQEILDTIKAQAFCEGELNVIKFMLETAKQQLENVNKEVTE